MKPQDLARALEKVPEKRLSLPELARECVDSQGELDLQRCIALQKEIREAIGEAAEYANQTREVIWTLERVMGR